MALPPLLEVEQVHKSFGDVRAVADVSFEVRPGEVLGFLGPNGAGKTTTLRMIMEITRPDSGRVLFEGVPRLDRRRTGYLPEERGLFEDAPVLETLAYLGSLHGMGWKAAHEEGRAWLERMTLVERANDKVGTLSKGNQQKVQLAGALLHGPKLVVLDEPFSGLDPVNQEMVLAMIGELRDQGAAVLLSAHQLNLVERLCDRFHLISRGRAVLEGTLEEIRRRAARGLAEVLRVDLRDSAGGLADGMRVEEALRGVLPDGQIRIRDGSADSLSVEAALPAGADLAPVLRALGERFAIRRVETHQLSLHEIYLKAVGSDADVPDEDRGSDRARSGTPAQARERESSRG